MCVLGSRRSQVCEVRTFHARASLVFNDTYKGVSFSSVCLKWNEFLNIFWMKRWPSRREISILGLSKKYLAEIQYLSEVFKGQRVLLLSILETFSKLGPCLGILLLGLLHLNFLLGFFRGIKSSYVLIEDRHNKNALKYLNKS